MECYFIDLEHIPNLPSTVSCIGFFDGFHKGHQALLKETLRIANQKGLPSALITFDPDPWTLFHPERKIEHITPMEDKKQMAACFGIEYFYILHFSRELASLNCSDFHQLLKSINIKALICGFDFHYASKNSGNIYTLKDQNDFDVHVVQAVEDKNGKISSTRIESYIQNGLVYNANQLLGYAYSLQGIVEHGFHRGTSLLQVPTANLRLSREYIVPQSGVYVGAVRVNGRIYKAMINVGKNPTFNNQKETIEAHLLDFKADLYGKELKIYFYDKIREEMKFNGIDELKTQLQKDLTKTRSYLLDLRYLYPQGNDSK